MIEINIAGDLVINQDYRLIDESLIKYFRNSDFNIINLECPITLVDESKKILKTGPHLRGVESSNIDFLDSLDVNLVTLANNHIRDYGDVGVSDTLEFCKRNNIISVGAGNNISEARQPKRLEIKGKKISIINFAENEWASAQESSGGSNPLDIIDNSKVISEEKEFSDIVIVIIHGGHEYYNLPSPRIKKLYRHFVECGASLIVGHHPHCISGFEIYQNTPIYYSLGNFLFTMPSKYNDWYQGLVLNIKIDEFNTITTQLNLVDVERDTYKITFSDIAQGSIGYEKINRLNAIISSDQLLLENWQTFVSSRSKTYLNYFAPISSINNRYIRWILNKLGMNLVSRMALTYVLNMLRCESHRDLSTHAISEALKK